MKFTKLIKVTNKEDNTVHWFTSKVNACTYIGCSPAYFGRIENKNSKRYNNFEVSVEDGSDVKWKDIDVI